MCKQYIAVDLMKVLIEYTSLDFNIVALTNAVLSNINVKNLIKKRVDEN